MSQRVFDPERVMVRLDNDKELLFELVDIFLSDYEAQLTTIESAISSGSSKALQDSAHAIKGALGNIGALLAHSYAYQLEAAGRSGEMSTSNGVFVNLRQAIADYIRELEQYRSQS